MLVRSSIAYRWLRGPIPCDHPAVSARLSPAAPVSDGRGFTVLLPLSLPFAILAGVAVFAAVSPGTPRTALPANRPGALVWGNGIFANRVELKAWLLQHKVAYNRWAQQHPAAVKLVTRRARKVPPHVRATAAPAPSRAAPSAQASNPVKFSPAPGPPVAAIILIVLVGVLALAAAVVPPRVLVRVVASARIIESRRLAELRIAVGAAGLSILCGFGLALLLG
jgi:hypothetical protein